MVNQYNAADLVNVPTGTQFTGYDPIGPSGTVRAQNNYQANLNVDIGKFKSVATQTYPHDIGSYAAGEYEPTDNGPVSGVYAPGSGITTVANFRLVHAAGTTIDETRIPGYMDGEPLSGSGIDLSNLTITKYPTPDSLNSDPFLSSSV